MNQPADPSSFNKPDRAILAETDLDGVGQAVLTLCHELWVVKDRMAALEAVLEKHGIDAGAEIEAYQPDENQQAELNKEGRILAERVMTALSGA